MKINQIELILTHSPTKNVLSQADLFSIFYFKTVDIGTPLNNEKNYVFLMESISFVSQCSALENQCKYFSFI